MAKLHYQTPPFVGAISKRESEGTREQGSISQKKREREIREIDRQNWREGEKMRGGARERERGRARAPRRERASEIDRQRLRGGGVGGEREGERLAVFMFSLLEMLISFGNLKCTFNAGFC